MQNSTRLDDPVIVVWVHHPNDITRNRIYSANLREMYDNEDEFVNAVPCWMVYRKR